VKNVNFPISHYVAQLSALTGLSKQEWFDILVADQAEQVKMLEVYKDAPWRAPATLPNVTRVLDSLTANAPMPVATEQARIGASSVKAALVATP
jgi:hypothetical protein